MISRISNIIIISKQIIYLAVLMCLYNLVIDIYELVNYVEVTLKKKIWDIIILGVKG